MTGYPQEVAARADAPTETGPGQAIACTEGKGPAPQAPLPQHCWDVADLERTFMPTDGDTGATAQQPPTTATAATPVDSTTSTAVAGPRATAAGDGVGVRGGGGGRLVGRSHAAMVQQGQLALGGAVDTNESATRVSDLEQPALGDRVVAERVRTSTGRPAAFGTNLRVEASLPVRQRRGTAVAVAEASALPVEWAAPAGVRLRRRDIATENAPPLSGYASGSGGGGRGDGGSGIGGGGVRVGGVGGCGGGGGTVYGGRPANIDNAGRATGGIIRTPVGRGTRRYPQEIVASARARTEMGAEQSVTGVGIITPTPHRPLSQHWMSVVDLGRRYSPPGGDMAVIVEPPAAAVVTAVAPDAGPRDTVARAGGGGGGRAAYGVARSGSSGGGGVCGGGGSGVGSGGGGGICGGGDGGGGRRISGMLEHVRSGAPPGFEGVARASVARVERQQGGNRRQVQEIPLAAAEEVGGNTAGARVPRHGNFHSARACDAMEAKQRTQLMRQSARLQRQRVHIQLQEAELERQRGQIERQRVLLERQRPVQPQPQVFQAAPLVFWSPGGLLVPVARTFASPDADARRAARAAMVPPGLTRG